MSEEKDARLQRNMLDVVEDAIVNSEAVRLFELTTFKERVQVLYVYMYMYRKYKYTVRHIVDNVTRKLLQRERKRGVHS